MTQQRRKGITKKHKGQLTRERLQYLLRGYNFFDKPFKDDDDAKRCWGDSQDKIMREWIRVAPGRRPWAWWKWDAPERRRCTSGDHPFDSPEHKLRAETVTGFDPYELFFGAPRFYTKENIQARVAFESEEDYLKRLHLMSDQEKIFLANVASLSQQNPEAEIAKRLQVT